MFIRPFLFSALLLLNSCGLGPSNVAETKHVNVDSSTSTGVISDSLDSIEAENGEIKKSANVLVYDIPASDHPEKILQHVAKIAGELQVARAENTKLKLLNEDVAGIVEELKSKKAALQKELERSNAKTFRWLIIIGVIGVAVGIGLACSPGGMFAKQGITVSIVFGTVAALSIALQKHYDHIGDIVFGVFVIVLGVAGWHYWRVFWGWDKTVEAIEKTGALKKNKGKELKQYVGDSVHRKIKQLKRRHEAIEAWPKSPASKKFYESKEHGTRVPDVPIPITPPSIAGGVQ